MPTRDALRFRLQPPVAGASSSDGVSGPVNFEIVTLTGRRVASPTLGGGPDAEFEWRPAEDGIRMDSGIYFLRAVDADGTTTAAKFVWLN